MYSKLNGKLEVENGEGVVLRDGKVFSTSGKELICEESVIDSMREGLVYPTKPVLDGSKIIRFVELRGKSEYSMGHSIAKVSDVVKNAEYSLALTDPEVGFGIYSFNQGMISAGKKPINGTELSFSTKSSTMNLVLLAKNHNAYKTLCRILTTISSLRQNGKTVNLKFLEDFELSDFILISDADSNNTLFKNLLKLNIKKDDLYLTTELQDDLSDERNRRVELLAKKNDIKVVLTNDYRQIKSEDSEGFRVIQSLKQKKVVTSAKLVSGENHYIHASDEVENWGVPVEWLDNTIEILNKIEIYDLSVKDNFNPIFNIPKGFNNEKEYFWHLAKVGLKRRFGDEEVPTEYWERLDYELGIIDSMGFNGYFLIVADFINYGKRNYASYDNETVARWKDFIKRGGYSENPINFGPGRGSAAGSLVAYATAITDVDPLKYGLLFERFLNPERVSMPDIDTDIPDMHRKEIIEYTRDFYNVSTDITESRVAGISAFGTYQLKALLKAIPRAYYQSQTAISLGEKLAGLVRDEKGFGIKEFCELPEVIALSEEDKRVARILEVAPLLSGMVSNLTQHAAGYVIAPEAVTEYLPTVFVEGEQLTAYTDVESCGLLKMDFLGLKAVTIIQSTLDKIQEKTGKSLTVTEILETATTDIDVFRTIASGGTKNLFQLSSSGMTDVVVKCLADIDEPGSEERAKSGDYFGRVVAAISMYRPGPLAFIPQFIENALHPEKIEYVVPEMADILSTSYGLMIYQESIMSLLQVVGGFTLGGADLARRAIGKKKFEVLQSLKQTFIYGDEKTGVLGGIKKTGRSAKELEDLWADVEAFASYGFNKSHAAAYSMVTIIEAWLFTKYPEYFASADLNKVGGNQKTTEREALHEMIEFYKDRGLDIRPVDINISEDEFVADNGAVYFGLNKVSNVASAAERISKERKERGEFKNLYDFLSRMQRNSEKGINKSVLKSLIVSGGFDSFPGTRKDKLDKLEELSNLGKLLKSNNDLIFDKYGEKYFDIWMDYQNEELDFQTLLAEEKRVTSFYISGHPTEKYTSISKKDKDFFNISELEALSSGVDLYLLGIVNSVRQITTKNGQLMSFVSIEDTSGSCDLVVFPDVYKMFGRYLEVGEIINVSAKKDINSRGTSYIVRSIKRSSDINIHNTTDHIQIKLSKDTSIAKEELETIINESKNPIHEYSPFVKMSYIFDGKELFRTKKNSHLEIPFDLTMVNYIKNKLGADSVRVIWKSDYETEFKDVSIESLLTQDEFELKIWY